MYLIILKFTKIIPATVHHLFYLNEFASNNFEHCICTLGMLVLFLTNLRYNLYEICEYIL